MLNELKLNLFSVRIYLPEFLAVNIFFVISILYIIPGITITPSLMVILLAANIFLLNFIGSRRRREITGIKTIIKNIRNNIYASADDIILSKNLSGLQEEIKLMFEKTRNDIEYLKRLERIRTEFLANVSHELRTPIFAIQGYIETLQNGAINDSSVNTYFLEKAGHHTNNLNNLLNDLIDISMIESGEMRMSYRYFGINEYLKNIANEYRPLAEEKGLELIYHPVNERLQLLGDKAKLKQVMTNLIQNSIKYTERGKIEIQVEEEPKHGKIIVKDTGIGIPPEDLDRIFERFYRVDKARSRAVGGTGLGLAIAKHIVEAHGSKIEVISRIDEGSEFSFRLKK